MIDNMHRKCYNIGVTIDDWSKMTYPVESTEVSAYECVVGGYWYRLHHHLQTYSTKKRDATLDELVDQGDADLKYRVFQWLWANRIVEGYPPGVNKKNLGLLPLRLLVTDKRKLVCILAIPPAENNQA